MGLPRPDEQWFAPKTVFVDPDAVVQGDADALQVKGTGFSSGDNRYWLFVDGAIRPRLSRKDDATGATQATRQLTVSLRGCATWTSSAPTCTSCSPAASST